MRAACEVTAARSGTGRLGSSEACLSPREAQVLGLVVDRYRNAEIAGRLHISKRTVESHVAALLRKLEAADRFALMRVGRTWLAAQPPRATGRVARPAGAGSVVAVCDELRRSAVQARAQSRQQLLSSARQVRQSARLLVDARARIDSTADVRERAPRPAQPGVRPAG